ncbi:MAG: type II toxin-antitoxin system RelE/ParE family toxin [Magnetococcales bacterium]|nr:type II toxin-antitoxin system RelE/ParE family toxin [Magnetococcales bacterium]
MVYRVILSGKVQKQIGALPRSTWTRIRSVIDGLEINPRRHGAIKIKGTADTWRIRAGVYRILYTIEDDRLVVLVLKVGHRREVYR